MKLSDFDYNLPPELIAQEPVTPREASRLLVVPLAGGDLQHRRVTDLVDLLAPGDLLVFNDTRVIPARLVGRKESGGRCELLLLEPLEDPPGALWRAMGQASKPIRRGGRLTFEDLQATVEEAEGEGLFTVRFDRSGAALEAALERIGQVPLPPYIRRAPRAEDRERYQTVLARQPGSAAAPTAGLHFSHQVLENLEARGIHRTSITLHIGTGTFLPVRSENLETHQMHAERYHVSAEAKAAVETCRARQGRVIAVGTTAVRTLESATEEGSLRPGWGRTSLFIRPGHHFQAIDALITNFHLPRSSLLMLVCAFGGTGRILQAYREAIVNRYRFYSYGDAMVLL